MRIVLTGWKFYCGDCGKDLADDPYHCATAHPFKRWLRMKKFRLQKLLSTVY